MIKQVFGHTNYLVDLDKIIFYSPKGKILNQNFTYNGYLTVTIDGKRRKVHRLVLMTITNCNGNGLQVNHKDGNKCNNYPDNLEWCTAKENTKHAEMMHLRTHKNTVIRKDRKLSDEDVLNIRKYLKEGLSTIEIRNLVPKANPKNIYAIKNNRSYKLIKDNTEVI